MGGYRTTVGRLTTDVGGTLTYGWDPGFPWSEVTGLAVGQTFNGPNGIVITMTANGPQWVAPVAQDADSGQDYVPMWTRADGTYQLLPWDFDSDGNLMTPTDYRKRRETWKQSGQILPIPRPS